MANMEELHTAASAYYQNASNGLRQLAEEFFNSMDTNGDGGVSFNEFVQFFVQNGYTFDPNLFRSLDRNGNGWLELCEVVTFYYILKTRSVRCKYCGSYQMGLYFTCVTCFNNARSTGYTYDLCCMCYGAGRHQQQHPHHNYFLDSYVLLRVQAGLPLPAGAPNPNVWCACCGNNRMGLYFTCVACFDNAGNTGHTYDLCSECYRARRHRQHHPQHNCFLDSYVLLRVKTGLPLLAGAQNPQQALAPRPAPNAPQQALARRLAPNAPQQRRLTTFQALEMSVNAVNLGVTVGNFAVQLGSIGCSIM
ncbi:hypothetical protein SO802_022695 [Lithocarpus litseifolius]|uniref:EF-hand domain-containing protein n=1 Tax=Lithocarpus litseifolius TaxID=425828 RepID=A0AAW2C5Z9_9ROSI